MGRLPTSIQKYLLPASGGLWGSWMVCSTMGLHVTLVMQNWWGGSRKIHHQGHDHIGHGWLGGWVWVAAVRLTPGKQNMSQRYFLSGRICYVPGMSILPKSQRRMGQVRMEPCCFQLVWENLTRLCPQMGFLRWYSSPSFSFFQKCRQRACNDSLSQDSVVVLCWAALPRWPRGTHLSEDPDQVWQECGIEEKCREVKLMLGHRPGCVWGRKQGSMSGHQGQTRHGDPKAGTWARLHQKALTQLPWKDKALGKLLNFSEL